MWKNKKNGRKRKPTEYIYLSGYQYCEAEGYLNLRSWPRIEKYINKHEFYRQLPHKRVKDTNMIDIENSLCLRDAIILTPVLNIEREPWGACSILRKVNDGVYRWLCSVRSKEYTCKKKYAFVFTVTAKLCINQNVVGI